MATLVKVMIQSGPAIAGSRNRAPRISARTTRPRIIVLRLMSAAPEVTPRSPLRADATLNRLVAGSGDGDDAVPRQDEQRDDREHERRRRAVLRDVPVGR